MSLKTDANGAISKFTNEKKDQALNDKLTIFS